MSKSAWTGCPSAHGIPTDRLGLKRSWFQSKTLYPHYDVTKTVRTRALALGAQGADRETIVSCARRMRSEMIQLYRATAASA
ncbi:DUF4031 domain-containing protein [Pseudomonas shirazica]|uniref:DUF4031 domain-containing protein n=1 Tax=Pseudomonas shirazica TaxID=1940636 RepID=UPI0035259EA5